MSASPFTRMLCSRTGRGHAESERAGFVFGDLTRPPILGATA